MRPIILFALLLLALTGCREEGEIITTTVTGTVPEPTIVRATVTTVVIDQGGSPINDATITGLGSGTRNNPDGSVTIDAGSLNSDGTLVTITAPGKWPERRILMPAGDGELVETFVLEDKVKAGEINPAVGGTINLGEGFSVTLTANTVVTDDNGNAYTGPVEIFINHDAPEDRAEMLNSPGNALAMLPDGSTASLESFGMMDIALEAPDGTPLVLDASTPAEVRMPLAPSSVPTAPDEVDFWVLDPDGFWLPAGTAQLGPNCYIVFVTSSGGYNCDVPRPAARLCARLVSPSGIPITHLPFSIDVTGGFSCWNATLDCDGEFCAWVAAETDLQLVLTDVCTGAVETVPIAPIPQGTQFDAGDVTVDFASTSFVATVAGCTGSGFPGLGQNEIWINGYGSAGGFVSTRPDGTAFVSDVSCGSEEVLIQAFTRDYKAASRLVRRAGDDDSAQNLEVCGDLAGDETFTLLINGTELSVTELAPIYWPGNGNYNWLLRAGAELEGEEYSLLLNLSDPATGIYADDNAAIAIYRLTPGQAYGEGRVYVDPDATLELTGSAYDATIGTFEGTFTATMNLQNDAAQTVEAVNLPVSGAFRIRL
jgi:hypothetical protein